MRSDWSGIAVAAAICASNKAMNTRLQAREPWVSSAITFPEGKVPPRFVPRKMAVKAMTATGRKNGPIVYFHTLSVQVVLDNAAVAGVDESNHKVEETQKRPGESIWNMGPVGDVSYGGEDHDNQCGNAHGKVKRRFAGHPAVGVPGDGEMRRHAKRQAVPRRPEAKCRYRQRQPHQPEEYLKRFAVHRKKPLLVPKPFHSA